MRGMFTAGVTDVLMENGVTFDGAIGVSAGAVFGCNYKSHQPGRVIRYNKKYCRDKRYASYRSLFRTGDLYGEQFCYHELPERLDPFDLETFAASPMEFYVVCTDVESGEAVYHRCTTGAGEDLRWMQASASMPLVSRVVQIGERKLLDGGMADSVPLRYFQSIGYDRCAVILTQPKGYIKKKNSMLPFMRVFLRKYPNMIRTVAQRHHVYNENTAFIEKEEEKGNIFVIRPPAPLHIGSVEHKAEKLQEVYDIGRREGEKQLEALRRFLAS